MRSEKEMMEIILHVAKNDDRIRAVGMNGSRTNPNAPKDIFQDYDIVYAVNDIYSFIHHPEWVDVFGERIIMQTPEDMAIFSAELGKRYSYLILFNDGNRIDLILMPLEELKDYCFEDTLTTILLDKDNTIPPIPAATDKKYWVSHPSEAFFLDCCNEFWWVSTYVTKGLWRDEITYAQAHLNMARAMLIKMLEWEVGSQTNFSVNLGKSAKHLKKFLGEEEWQALLQTYASGSNEAIWKALFSMMELFQKSAQTVASELSLEYHLQEAQKVIHYTKHVSNLPKDAQTIF